MEELVFEEMEASERHVAPDDVRININTVLLRLGTKEGCEEAYRIEQCSENVLRQFPYQEKRPFDIVKYHNIYVLQLNLLPLVALVIKYLRPLLPFQPVREVHEGRVQDHLVIRQVH